jgi:hypothetical protein
MSENVSQKLGKIIHIDEDKIHEHLGELVRGTVEETLNKLLDAEAEQLCNSALMLVTARLRHIAGTRWGTYLYLNMNLLREMEREKLAS